MKFSSVLSTLAAAILCSFGFAAAAKPAAPKQVTLVFRYDDLSEKPDRTSFEIALLAEFARHKIPCTIGVIPSIVSGDPHDPSPQPLLTLGSDKLEILRDGVDSGLIEVAQHGLTHQTQPGRGPEMWTEFGGRPLADQVARIRKGKEILSGLLGQDPVTFIPPWNSYDGTTVQAAQLCGFSVFSGNGKGPALSSSLRFVPATAEPRDLQQICTSASSSRDRQPVVVVLFHEYDFREVDPMRGYLTMPQFSKLLDWVASHSELKTSLLRDVPSADASRYLAFQSLQQARRFLPSSLLHVLALDWPAGTYPSVPTIVHFRTTFRAMVPPLYLGLFGLAITGGHWMRARSAGPKERYVFPALFLALSCVILVFSLHPVPLTAKHLCLLAALGGLSIGSWTELLRSVNLVKQ